MITFCHNVLQVENGCSEKISKSNYRGLIGIVNCQWSVQSALTCVAVGAGCSPAPGGASSWATRTCRHTEWGQKGASASGMVWVVCWVKILPDAYVGQPLQPGVRRWVSERFELLIVSGPLQLHVVCGPKLCCKVDAWFASPKIWLWLIRRCCLVNIIR